jgi:hypothetical protein
VLHELVEGECLGVLDFDVKVNGFGQLHGFSELEARLEKTLHDPRFELAQEPNATEPGEGVHDGGGVWCIDPRYSDFPARNASANMRSNAHWIFNQFHPYQPTPGPWRRDEDEILRRS